MEGEVVGEAGSGFLEEPASAGWIGLPQGPGEGEAGAGGGGEQTVFAGRLEGGDRLLGPVGGDQQLADQGSRDRQVGVAVAVGGTRELEAPPGEGQGLVVTVAVGEVAGEVEEGWGEEHVVRPQLLLDQRHGALEVRSAVAEQAELVQGADPPDRVGALLGDLEGAQEVLLGAGVTR